MKNLSVALGRSEEELKTAVGKLEAFCGFPSEDVRLLAESRNQLRAKLSQLGLDPDDTTGPELYHALLAKYAQDAATVDRVLGITTETSVEQKLDKVCQLLNHTLHLRDAWTLKTTTAKQLLAAAPPKKVMKQLHYRSVDSLLKREDIPAVILMSEQIESASWRKKFDAKVAKLTSTNFELQPPRVVRLSPKLVAGEPRVAISHLGAAVALWPANSDIPTLTMALMLADGLSQIGEQNGGTTLEPAHVALKWWTDAEHLVFDEDGVPVSLNFKDVAANHLQNSSYGQHQNQNGHQALWAKLMDRYKNYIDELPQEFHAVQKSAAPALALEPVEIYE